MYPKRSCFVAASDDLGELAHEIVEMFRNDLVRRFGDRTIH